jgi:hypothetical protein
MLEGLSSHTYKLVEHEGLCGSGHRSVISYVHERELYCCVCALFKAEFNMLAPIVCSAFYSSRSGSYIVTKGLTCAPGWLDPYIVGHYQLEVANVVFNGVGMSGLVVLPRHTQSAVWHRAVGSRNTVEVPGECSTVLVLHCSHNVAACPHVLQALTTLHAHTSCRTMMALTSGALEICARALGTCEPSCTGRPTRCFFMFVARGQQGTA